MQKEVAGNLSKKTAKVFGDKFLISNHRTTGYSVASVKPEWNIVEIRKGVFRLEPDRDIKNISPSERRVLF